MSGHALPPQTVSSKEQTQSPKGRGGEWFPSYAAPVCAGSPGRQEEGGERRQARGRQRASRAQSVACSDSLKILSSPGCRGSWQLPRNKQGLPHLSVSLRGQKAQNTTTTHLLQEAGPLSSPPGGLQELGGAVDPTPNPGRVLARRCPATHSSCANASSICSPSAETAGPQDHHQPRWTLYRTQRGSGKQGGWEGGVAVPQGHHYLPFGLP